MDGRDQDNGGDKNSEKKLVNRDQGKQPMQEPQEPDQGNPTPKKLRTNAGSSSVTGLDLDKGLELDLDLRLGTGGSGSKRRFGFGYLGSSSVQTGGFASGANIGVQSCLSGQFGTTLFGVKIGELGNAINTGAMNWLTGGMNHDLFVQKIGENMSNMSGERSNLGERIVESGHFGANYDYGEMRTASKYVCECCLRPYPSSRSLGGHRSKCKELHEQLRREAKEAGASSAKRYVYDRARGGYVCENCGKKFNTPHGLARHMNDQSCREDAVNFRRYDIEPANNLHVCCYCGMNFESGPRLGGHISACKKRHQKQRREGKEDGEDDDN